MSYWWRNNMSLIGYYGGFSLLLAVWIAWDAEAHGQDGLTWGVIVFFLNVPAVIAYFIFFRGTLTPPRRHDAISRNDDFNYRAQYSQMSTSYGSPRQGGTMSGDGYVEPDFSDPTIDDLIASGKFQDARNHANDMIKIAREMNDTRGVKNYEKIRLNIQRAQVSGPKDTHLSKKKKSGES